MLQIPHPVYDQIRRHSEDTYPNECCGILLGQLNSAIKSITEAIPTPNTSPTPARHYEISSKDLVRILSEAHAAEREVLGFYHCHPDHPAQPSSTDLAEAHWLGCSYLVTAVVQGRATDTHAFHLAGRSEDDKYFDQEEILILE
jgi:proteasome lid subunit RPN8/RPN11